jgi:hypothetical protein
MRNVNLYDSSLRLRKDPLTLENAAAAVAVAVVVTGLLVLGARSSLSRTQAAAESVGNELEARQAAMRAVAAKAGTNKADTALQAEVGRAQRILVHRRGALQALEGDQGGPTSGFAGRLESLGRQSIEGLWLTGLTLREEDVLLRGRAIDPALIPLYVQRLEQESSLQGRTFKALDVARPLLPAAKPTTPATESTPGAEPPPPRRAGYVEFTLTGPGSAASSPAAKEPTT